MTTNEKILKNYPIPVFLEQTKTIVDQMQKGVCKICLDDGSKGTGFFCKIPYPDKNNLLPVFITNNHVISEKYLNDGKNIIIKRNIDQNQKEINIKNKLTYTNSTYDVTIIEIKPNQDKIDYFLELDENIFNDNYMDYIGRSIYLVQYPYIHDEQKVAVSYGILKNRFEDKKYDFIHYCSTEYGSSGSPILNLNNNKIIGIHKKRTNIEHNVGSFILYSINEFINKNFNKKRDNNSGINLCYNNNVNLESYNRILKEFKELNANPLSNIGCTISLPNDNNIYEWLCSMSGPKNTSYKGGLFYFKVLFPYDYPKKPPEVYFVTPIYHLNILNLIIPGTRERLGHVSINTLNWWGPETLMRKVFLDIFVLMIIPNPDSPFGLDRASELRNNRALYEEKVSYFTKKYASPINGYKPEWDRNWDFTYKKK